MTATKILWITYYWPPSGGPGVQRSVKFARYLPHQGIHPLILTVNPRQASYPLPDPSLTAEIPNTTEVFYSNTFEPLSLYARLAGGKMPQPGFANESKPSLAQKISRFIRGNFFIPDARVGWNSYAASKAREIIHSHKPQAIVSSSPPHSSQLIGLKLKRQTGLPWIADMRDPWTDIYYYNQFYHTSWARKKDAKLEKAVLENADAIIVVSDSIKELFCAKSPLVNPSKVHVIPNGYDIEDFANPLDPTKDDLNSSPAFRVVYTGTMSEAYPHELWLESLQHLAGLLHPVPLELHMAGQISHHIREAIQSSPLGPNTFYYGYLNHKKSVALLQKADALLLIIPQVENNAGILTGKLFEYLAARKAVFCVGPVDGDASKILTRCEIGKAFGYHQIEDAKTWMQQLASEWMPNHSLKAGNDHILQYSRQHQAGQLAEVIRGVIEKNI